MALGLDAWWTELAYQASNTPRRRGQFILGKLREFDAGRLRAVLDDLYGDQKPDAEEIGSFEWLVILAAFGASDEEIADVRRRMGRGASKEG